MATTTTSDTTALTRGAGPLTTVFTTPDYCNSLYWTNTVTPPLSSIVCMPPRWQQYWVYEWGFYSPGICPTGYSQGCEFPTSIASTSLGWVYYGGDVYSNETVRLCCPTGYSCLATGPYSYSKCVATTNTEDLVYGIQVRWQESDLSILETDPTVPGSTWSAPASTTANSPATETNANEEGTQATQEILSPTYSSSSATDTATTVSAATKSNGFSTAAVIGLTAAALTVGLLLSGVLFLARRARKRKREETKGLELPSTVSLAPPESPFFSNKCELESIASPISVAPSELQGEREVVEMPVPHFVAELPGSMPADYEKGGASEGSCKSSAREDSDDGNKVEEAGSRGGSPGHARRRSSRAYKYHPKGTANSPYTGSFHGP